MKSFKSEIGWNADTGDGSSMLAIGVGASTNNTSAGSANSQSVALGTRAQAWGDQAIAIGGEVKASGNSSVAIGGDDIDRVRDFLNFNNTREFEVVAEIDGLEILSMSMYAKKLFYRIKE